jgi:hypothetical protein
MTLKRGLTILSAAAALLLGACGGGNSNPTGPARGGGGGEVDTWRLVALGRAELPTDAQVEDCPVTHFYSGKLELRDGDAWRLTLQVHDDSGDWGYEDDGVYQDDGDSGWFRSNVSGVTYQAMYNGPDMGIMYDWCFNGQPDLLLVFE